MTSASGQVILAQMQKTHKLFRKIKIHTLDIGLIKLSSFVFGMATVLIFPSLLGLRTDTLILVGLIAAIHPIIVWFK